tara:strand:+ start:9253 stop:9483 length:231 start_codon:yes stop_codon:yes gene_type:complete
MSCDKNDIIMFVDEHFDNKIDKDTFTFVKELYEYVSFLYDGDYSETDDLTSESDDESTVKETLKIKKDKEGFYSLD